MIAEIRSLFADFYLKTGQTLVEITVSEALFDEIVTHLGMTEAFDSLELDGVRITWKRL